VDLLEQREYGPTHAGLCADVLSAWHFPDELCVAIGRHHDPPSTGAAPLRRTLQAGVALAALADGSVDVHALAGASLEAAGVARADRPALVAQVRREGTELAGALLT
jgi:HD-like signal output (HDOD) protein